MPIPRDLADAVARVVARLAEERGWSGNQLAQKAGLPQSTLSRKLRGLGILDLAEVEALCGALGVEVVELIGWAQN